MLQLRYQFHLHPTNTSLLNLQRIHKLRILLIRQVQKLLLVQLPIPGLQPPHLILPIHAPIIHSNERQVQHTDTPTHQNRDLSRRVARFILRSESLWSYDITRAIRDQVKSANGSFLRVPSCVDGGVSNCSNGVVSGKDILSWEKIMRQVRTGKGLPNTYRRWTR